MSVNEMGLRHARRKRTVNLKAAASAHRVAGPFTHLALGRRVLEKPFLPPLLTNFWLANLNQIGCRGNRSVRPRSSRDASRRAAVGCCSEAQCRKERSLQTLLLSSNLLHGVGTLPMARESCQTTPPAFLSEKNAERRDACVPEAGAMLVTDEDR